MKTLQVLSALLCYPQSELQAALGEMIEVLDQENVLPEREHRALLALIDQIRRTDLIELQERYVRLFDQGRALSLHLFEHIHGESRDRGQAMIDLLRIYQQHGFELSARELPDYLPLFLEYLAQRPTGEALDMLVDAMHVIALLGARLAEQGSDYHVVFDALAALVGEPADIEAIRQQAATEGPDETIVNMDKIWEEEAVTFLANQDGCGKSQGGHATVQPVRWVSPPGSTPRAARSL
ncbi:nitrate reductase molybdenum cofactor assembly chaperone [Candidatus Competibacter phosphatis]|uniref:Nitrate reductase molybdenum cofactor assembly chaperone n=1 Tax=Candidatus Competibacter phosphatis TaxID=221280 RepID=A0ABX1TR85_9GAMM|nr:nitrate reductase molybdenum cofactor assembly chaperone [Candidatus Competibacter phosphatis]NMQ20613.1 nitrate reductase molybdenum cofactor assembly chaperone [Candidatus Competibacter phosphatis]